MMCTDGFSVTGEWIKMYISFLFDNYWAEFFIKIPYYKKTSFNLASILFATLANGIAVKMR